MDIQHGVEPKDHGHSHATAPDNEGRVLWALLLTGGFLLAEVIGGILSGSLALLADAGHMLTDTAALGLSFAAFRASRRPATGRHSYGMHRFQVLAAFINGAMLIGIAAWIFIEALQRIFQPVEVLAGPMMVVAILGLAVNVAAFFILHGGDQDNINMRGAALHVLGDLLGSVAAIVAAGVILWTGWMPIDPILSVLVALLIVRSAWRLVAGSAHVLMEGAPDGIDVDELRHDLMAQVPGVTDIHHVHLWMLTPTQPLITLHATVSGTADDGTLLRALQTALAERFDLHHTTIQIESESCCTDRTACAME
ncbi:cation diffusion facilitator family transporter [Paramagnetospirillum magnetotacticum]|nr:cation diffusion facilitator family transporter [Paramagnetospirillum magnetotacticum]